VRDEKVFAVNVEKGIFGIIQDVSKESDPLIWQAVTTPGEVIISNVLVTKEGAPRWLGDGRPPPLEGGTNFSGHWNPGKQDIVGKDIPYAHKNARYTVEIASLDNCDSQLNDPQGAEVGGVIYGGRDSDTWPPVCESFNWSHGVITFGASLESELTFATLGKEGQRKFNPFSNLDFLAIPIGDYINMHLQFVNNVTTPPKIFAVNYFLKDEQGKFLNAKEDKHVWLKWMEQRVHGERGGIKTAIGYIPTYEDLKDLFKQVLAKEYRHQDYLKQFSIRIEKNLEKIERIKTIYQNIDNVPSLLFDILEEQKGRCNEVKKQYGDIVSPESF
jgi:phosphoenolpyruvate carboxykinase (GTP)